MRLKDAPNWGIEPVPDRLRVLGTFDTFLLWTNLGISLLVLVAASYFGLSLEQAVLATIVENAQLAALEITYGVDADDMPRMLDAVRASVARTSDLLEHLLWHASGVDLERRG